MIANTTKSIAFVSILALSACDPASQQALKHTDASRTISEGVAIGAGVTGLACALGGDASLIKLCAAVGGAIGGAVGYSVAVTKGQFAQSEQRIEDQIAQLRETRNQLNRELRNLRNATARKQSTLKARERLRAAQRAAERQIARSDALIRKSPRPTTREELDRQRQLAWERDQLNDALARSLLNGGRRYG